MKMVDDWLVKLYQHNKGEAFVAHHQRVVLLVEADYVKQIDFHTHLYQLTELGMSHAESLINFRRL